MVRGQPHPDGAPMHLRHLAVSALRGLSLAALIWSGAARAEGAADPVWPTRQWQTTTPEEQGMDSAALARLVNFGAAHSFDSLLIARHGRIMLDAYYAPYNRASEHPSVYVVEEKRVC
ncbi:hypothetical protein [Bradyrhizobium sp. JR3.5]